MVRSFDDMLTELGYSQAGFARLLDVKSPLTVAHWCSGHHNPPGPVVTIVEYLLSRPEAKAWFEARRPGQKRKSKRNVNLTDEQREARSQRAKDQWSRRRQDGHDGPLIGRAKK